MWTIEQIDIRGAGFIGGFSVLLPPGLTCIIGPRGSGKTTLAEAIRYTLGDLPADARSRQALVRDNLGQAVLMVKATTNGGEKYTVSRTYPGTSSITAGDGRALSMVELDRGTFLPIDAFSSREIEDIADEALGTKRKALLDALRPDEMREIQLAVNDARRSLEANSDQIRAMRQQLSDLTEQIEELASSRARLDALPKPEGGDEAKRLASSAKQQNLTVREVAQLTKILQESKANRESLGASLTLNEAMTLEFDAESRNASIMSQARDALNAAVDDISKTISGAIDRAAKFEATIRKHGSSLTANQTEQSVEHQRLVEANAALGQAAQVRAKTEQDVARLAQLERDLATSKEKLRKEFDTRRALKATYLLERDKISAVRESVASELTQKCGASVRIRVMRNSDNQAYQQALLRALAGSRLRNQDEIVQAIMALRPEQLAQMMLDKDYAEFEAAVELGPDRSKKLLDSILENVNALELEVLPTEDRIYIELNVGTHKEPNYRDAAELSRGQKCTALLPLLLARRDTPLLIDQPEDNLDNHFIFETVVDSIRRLKGRRQMIFITHNANIPVLGEADLVIVMNSDGRRGYIEKAASLDDCKEEIIDLLEGGHDAFEQRRKRYGGT